MQNQFTRRDPGSLDGQEMLTGGQLSCSIISEMGWVKGGQTV